MRYLQHDGADSSFVGMTNEGMIENLYFEWHDKVTIAFSSIFCRNSLDDDRGEWVLVFEADIVFSHDRECLEEVFAIDSDDIFLSFDRA